MKKIIILLSLICLIHVVFARSVLSTPNVVPCNATAIYVTSGYNSLMDKVFCRWNILCDTSGMGGCQWSYQISGYIQNETGGWTEIVNGDCGNANIAIACGNLDMGWQMFVSGVVQNNPGNYKFVWTVFDGPCNNILGVAGIYTQTFTID